MGIPTNTYDMQVSSRLFLLKKKSEFHN